MSNEKTEIRTLLAPVTGGTVMLPGSVIAEVIEYSDLKPFKDAPSWLLGGLNWSDWKVPVISFSSLAGTTQSEEPGARSRVLIIKSLSENSNIPYLGILISGLPRLAKVTASRLTKPAKLAGFPCVFKQLDFGEEQVLIPDLDELTRITEQALNSE